MSSSAAPRGDKQRDVDALMRDNTRSGADIARGHWERADCVVIGSGPAGAAAARELSGAGLSVIIVEDGPLVGPHQLEADGFSAMAQLYRDLGATVSLGRPMLPLVTARAVGGTSVVNGAISWRLPRDVYKQWVAADAALADALPWARLEETFDAIEARLGIAPTDASVAGANNELLAAGAEALGIAHRPIARNVRGCRGSGRCLQGCPIGAKTSMDRTLLPDACERGARILCDTRVERIMQRGGRAVGVVARTRAGARLTIEASHAVVLAAGALYSPLLLLQSGIDDGPVGRHFQCHPGIAVVGRFAQHVDVWRGATQGHEVIGLRREGIKIEALGYDLSLAAARARGTGAELSRSLDELRHHAHWGAAIRAEACGRVRRGPGGRPLVSYSLTERDLALARRGVSVIGQMMLAAGARHVEPGLHGAAARLDDAAALRALERDGPTKASAFSMAATHLFGTCRMGSDAARAVVRPDFRHHRVEGLYVADSSVFASNTGVNPQTSIIALATLCGQRIVEHAEHVEHVEHVAYAGRSARRADRAAPAPPTAIATAPEHGAPPVSASTSSVLPCEPRAQLSAVVGPSLDASALVEASSDELRAVLRRSHPLAPGAVAGRAFHGTSLGLPKLVDRLLWKRFIKVFAERADGTLHGWNVRVDQRAGDFTPLRRDGRVVCFGPYEATPRDDGTLLLDYGAAASSRFDPLRAMRDPLRAVNAGSADLLIGSTYLELGRRAVMTPSMFVLERAGALSASRHGVAPRRRAAAV